MSKTKRWQCVRSVCLNFKPVVMRALISQVGLTCPLLSTVLLKRSHSKPMAFKHGLKKASLTLFDSLSVRVCVRDRQRDRDFSLWPAEGDIFHCASLMTKGFFSPPFFTTPTEFQYSFNTCSLTCPAISFVWILAQVT